MRRRPAIPALRALALAVPALLSAPAPVLAQGEIRSITVPAEGGVIIPSRSAPRLAARPAGTGTGTPIPPRAARASTPGPVLLPDTGTGLAAPVLGYALPAIAGALLGGAVAGSKGGSSAPARTR